MDAVRSTVRRLLTFSFHLTVVVFSINTCNFVSQRIQIYSSFK